MSDVTALIVCGGRGTRLGPLGGVLNKCLLPVNGVPMVVQVAQFAMDLIGARRLFFLTGHLGEQVEDVVRGYLPGRNLAFVREEQGTARAIASASLLYSTDALLYAHANVVLGRAATEALSSEWVRGRRGTRSSVWAVSSADIAYTHPRLLCANGFVTGTSKERGAWSVGVGVIRHAVLESAMRRTPLLGETAEQWLFSSPSQTSLVRPIEIGSDWLHVEDLASYRSSWSREVAVASNKLDDDLATEVERGYDISQARRRFLGRRRSDQAARHSGRRFRPA